MNTTLNTNKLTMLAICLALYCGLFSCSSDDSLTAATLEGRYTVEKLIVSDCVAETILSNETVSYPQLVRQQGSMEDTVYTVEAAFDGGNYRELYTMTLHTTVIDTIPTDTTPVYIVSVDTTIALQDVQLFSGSYTQSGTSLTMDRTPFTEVGLPALTWNVNDYNSVTRMRSGADDDECVTELILRKK